MKYKRLFSTLGMVLTLAAFMAMAAGIVLTIHALFFSAVALLLVGIVFSSVLPTVITAKWQKMIVEHGVSARAKLSNITEVGGRFGEIRLDFGVIDSEIMTSAYINRADKDKYTLDKEYSIKYDPNDTDLCLIIGDKTPNRQEVQEVKPEDATADEVKPEDAKEQAKPEEAKADEATKED